MSDLRDNLQKQMDKKGWNAYDLESACERAGGRVPQPTIQRFLSGKHGDPRGDTVRKLAKGLGITEAELRGLGVGVGGTSTIRHEPSTKTTPPPETDSNKTLTATQQKAQQALADLPDEVRQIIDDLISLSSSGQLSEHAVNMLKAVTDTSKKGKK